MQKKQKGQAEDTVTTTTQKNFYKGQQFMAGMSDCMDKTTNKLVDLLRQFSQGMLVNKDSASQEENVKKEMKEMREEISSVNKNMADVKEQLSMLAGLLESQMKGQKK